MAYSWYQASGWKNGGKWGRHGKEGVGERGKMGYRASQVQMGGNPRAAGAASRSGPVSQEAFWDLGFGESMNVKWCHAEDSFTG